MVWITDKDIERTEKLLLPKGCFFNDEHRAFIRCMESRDVVACPGSGKTTALLAKILILASNMPFPDNRCICILTHTNVAIDLIKAKLQNEANRLLSYPNFFGTIQKFVNTFLAIPAYIERFGTRHIIMNQDIYNEKASQAFYTEKLEYKAPVIYSQVRTRLKGKTSAQQREEKISFFKDLAFDFDESCISYLRGNDKKIVLKGNSASKSYIPIHNAKYGLLQNGFLQYSDAFSLAKWYINKWQIIKEAMKRRFAFVFVDEAQDTDKIQLEILHSVFDSSDIIVQYLGDPNQAIYHSFVNKEVFWKHKANPIHLSDTKRFGKTIANLLNTVRIDSQISLTENPTINSANPCVLTYTEHTINLVLPAFAKLIQKQSLHQNDSIKDPIFKAVGWVGKDRTEEGKLCLRSYFPQYRKSIQNRKQHFKNLVSYLHMPLAADLKVEGTKIYKDAILRGIVRAFEIGEVNHPKSNRPFTPRTLLQWLREEKESTYKILLTKLAEWVIKLHRKEKTAMQIKNEVASLIHKKQGIKHTDVLNQFLDDNEPEFLLEEQKSSNIFKTDGGISIEVGTVHSVKGKTHTATLYLETFNYDFDSKRLLPFLKGKYPKEEISKARTKENLRVAHVAFSRPTHLVAFACHENNINGHEEELSKNGWSILNVERV